MIRTATPSDTDRIVDMAAHFLAATPYGQLLPVPRDRLLALVDPICAQGVIFLADTPKPFAPIAIGLLALVDVEHPFSGVRYADEQMLWVEPPFRGHRVSDELMDAGEAWCAARGLAFLKMVAPADSAVGRWYTRRGFAAVETAFIKPIGAPA